MTDMANVSNSSTPTQPFAYFRRLLPTWRGHILASSELIGRYART
ncbi:hypothetical protein MC7420_375 [Coleofasciculus chthonoplastes PCC 7420]|uniref:Uncharacterized protein n=2 Tax=Coleofasciculus chthonoplastes TaxID=64178 RepID=B4VL26_9CYAN|nr:hypothetical protein MC7420_375 [Coleofasciculus chthonoplastes PCC 7420]